MPARGLLEVMFIWAGVLWVAGLLTVVPYATYYLFYYAARDEYAVLITFALFWIFGYWGVVGPLLMVFKVRRVFRRLEQAQTEGRLADMLRDREAEEAVVDFIASENRIPRFVASRVYRLLVARCASSQDSSSVVPARPSQR